VYTNLAVSVSQCLLIAWLKGLASENQRRLTGSGSNPQIHYTNPQFTLLYLIRGNALGQIGGLSDRQLCSLPGREDTIVTYGSGARPTRLYSSHDHYTNL